MRYRFSFLALALATAAPPAVSAQAAAAPPNPYRVLFITRETVKPGKGDAHDKLESDWARSLAAAKMPFGTLAMKSVTGPRETWFVSGFPSYAAYARLNSMYEGNAALGAVATRLDPQESDLLAEARGMVLQARDDLSYGGPANMARMRFFSVSRISVRPGMGPTFEEARVLVKRAHETARATDSYSIYEATAGAPAGTFFIFVPRKSLAEIDDAPTIHGAAYTAALGGEEGRKKMAGMAATYLISSQTDHFAFLPLQSIVGAAWVKEDPTYWKNQTVEPAP